MTLMPIAPAPGICLSAANYAVGKDLAFVSVGAGSFRQGQGRWSDGTNMEFIAGFPQKIAGWAAASTPMEGTPRAVDVWRDDQGLARVCIGTTTHLYSWQAGTLTDITPLMSISISTLSGPITTTNSSNIVAIADNSQHLQNGDWVFLSAASAVGGLTIDGWYQVSTRTGSGYNITTPTAATSGAGPGGGTTQFQCPRITISNPFTTTINSATVNVTHTSGPAVAGNFVTFSGASAVGGLTISGEYQIQSVVDVNNFTITAASAATSSAGPGGGSVSITYDVQIAQIVSGAAGAVVWGQTGQAWGAGQWGTDNVTPAVLADGWTLSAYGSQMLAAPVGGTIYVFDPKFGGRAYPLLNAPTTMNAMFVTPERFVVALGINGNLMEIAWSDQNDYTVWTTTPTNTANTGRTFVGGSYFVGGVGIRDGVSLIFTNISVFQMNYTGGQEIYSTPQIGDNCGLVSPTAVCEEGGIVYWMSDQDWWSWNGGVTILPSDDVRDSVYRTGLNRTQLSKCTAMLNRAKRQVRFFFPSSSANENDTGMIFQYDQQCWAPIAFGRTCGTDANLLQTPISCDTSNMLFYDETGTDANGTPLPCSIQIGDMDISNGDKNVDVMGLIPNFQMLVGNATFNALASYYPSDMNQVDGPWVLTSSTQRQDLRLDGKLFAFNISLSDLGATMRLGVSRLDVQTSGARR